MHKHFKLIVSTMLVNLARSRILLLAILVSTANWGQAQTEEIEPVQVFQGHTGRVNTLEFSRDGAKIVTGSDDGQAKLWNSIDAKLLFTYEPILGFEESRAKITSVVFSPNGKMIAIGDIRGRIQLRLAFENPSQANGAKANLIWAGDGIASMTFCPDGKTLVSGHRHRETQLWDAATGGLLAVFPSRIESKSFRVRSVAISPDGKTLAEGSEAKDVQIWGVGDCRLQATFRPPQPQRDVQPTIQNVVAFSPNGQLLASLGVEKEIVLWEIAKGRPQTILPASFFVNDISFSRDGKLLAVGDQDGFVTIWEVTTGKEQAKFVADLIKTRPPYPSWPRGVLCLSFSPDGKSLATGGSDQIVRMWNVAEIMQKGRSN